MSRDQNGGSQPCKCLGVHSGQRQQLLVRNVGGTFEDRQGGMWLEFHGGPEGQVGETEAAWGPSRVGGVASRRKWHLRGSLAFRQCLDEWRVGCRPSISKGETNQGSEAGGPAAITFHSFIHSTHIY